MATSDEISRLRLMTDEPGPDVYDDTELNRRLDEADSIYSAAAAIWQEKAARFSSLVNVSESGSSRALGDLHKNALEMAKKYESLGTVETAEESSRPTRVNSIGRL